MGFSIVFDRVSHSELLYDLQASCKYRYKMIYSNLYVVGKFFIKQKICVCSLVDLYSQYIDMVSGVRIVVP